MKKLVLHLQEPESDRLITALHTLCNFAVATGAEEYAAVLLVNGDAVKHFTKGTPFAREILETTALPGINIELCSHALGRLKIPVAALIPVCGVIPFGIVELVQLQQKGFAYVKI